MAPRCCGSAAAVSGGKRSRRWPVLGGRTKETWGPNHIPGTAWGGQGLLPSDVVAASSMTEVSRGRVRGRDPSAIPVPARH